MRPTAPQPALLALEDGYVQEGYAVGASGTVFGEIVFNTSMTGYQEILTDPSYFRQIITFCYPLIGNYGVVDDDDNESRQVFASGLVVREMSPLADSSRMTGDLPSWLAKRGVVGIGGVDTRELVLHIREQGAMRGAVSTEILDPDELIKQVRASQSLVGIDSITPITIDRPEVFEPEGTDKPIRLAALDCGMKRSIGRLLAKSGFHVTVLPATTPPEEILNGPYDALFLSNGPGDPAGVPWLVENVRTLIQRLPTVGICLGHQLLGQALGGKTFKLKFGHRGANHPVKDLRTGEIQITCQNHGFCVDHESLGDTVEVTHLNLNDQTVEGLRHRELPILSVQHHPEASPGPHDAAPLFDEFYALCRQSIG